VSDPFALDVLDSREPGPVTCVVVDGAVIWVAVQNVGGDLAGGATDPNSGLPVLLLALAYWPLVPARSSAPVVRSGVLT